ncbi:MAG: hypothetical protein RL120_05250, partial [Gammaproteobacteria bacterium]
MSMSKRTLTALLILSLFSCSESGPVFHEDSTPQRLSEWGLFQRDGNTLLPHPDTLVFEPANQLFSDYASKLRTLWLPDGAQIQLLDGEFQYPVGTILSKSFYFGATDDIFHRDSISLDHYRLIET